MNNTMQPTADQRVPLKLRLLLWCGVIVALMLAPRVASAQGAVPYLPQPLDGCYDVAVYGVGLYDGGQGEAVIEPPPGEIVLALMEWVGAEDTTPGGATLDGSSTITVNGNTVIGNPAEALAPDGSGGLLGNAAYDPDGHVDVGPRGWFAWNANIGPGGLDIIPAQFNQPLTLQIADWDAVTVGARRARQTNGASITVVYRTDDSAQPGVCDAENNIQILTGIDTYHQSQNEDISELLVFDIEPAPIARIVRMFFSHAGTDRGQQACRGGAIWMMADDTMATRPGSGFFVRDHDIVAIDDTNQDGTARGYGINGGVEIVNDPFTSPALPCTPALNPFPDESYEPGHPYPTGASAAPYRAQAMLPADGGDVDGPGEWGVVEMHVILPPNTEWMAFQLESEPDQNGESGGWVGNGVFAVVPTATLGDRVWEDVNGNGLQDAGEPGIEGVTVNLYDLSDTLVTSTQTVAGGLYQFSDLPTGDYVLEFGAPVGFAHSPQHAGGPANAHLDSDPDPATGRTETITLVPSQVDLDWDAGLIQLTSAISIQKLPDLQKIPRGAPAEFQLIVRNDGDNPLTNVRVSDPLAPDCEANLGDMAAGVEESYTCSLANVDADFVNVAAVTGLDEFGVEVSAQDNAVVDVLPTVELTKRADPMTLPEPGGDFTFALTIHNTSSEPVVITGLDDTNALNQSCLDLVGQTLAVEGTATCSYVVNHTAVDSYENVATVAVKDDEGNPAQANDRVTVEVFDVPPAIKVDKGAAPGIVEYTGGDVTFTVTVHNESVEAVTLFFLEDDIHGPLDGLGTCALPQIIPLDGVYTCEFTLFVVAGDEGETDTITAKVNDDEGNEASASDTATVLSAPPITNSAIGDYVWVDTNADGIQDDDEEGLGGVVVQLFRANDQLVDTTETDASGLYQFTELMAGDYYLVFTVPSSQGAFVGFSPMHRGGDPAKDSDVYSVATNNGEKGRTDVFTLLVDDEDMTRDAGLVAPLAIDLVSFAAHVESETIVVEWVTEAEVDTLGYHLFRSTSSDREEAVRITNQLIPSQGSDGGTYNVIDESVVAGVTFHYWLREVTGADFSEYGPVTARISDASNGVSLYLPLIMGD